MSQADIALAALELVKEFGSSATYTSVKAGEYDPVSGTVASAKISQTVLAMISDLTLQSNGLSLRYGTTVIAGDKEGYIIPPQNLGGSSFVVSPGTDKLTIGGVTYSVVTFKELNLTGSNPCLYMLYLRR